MKEILQKFANLYVEMPSFYSASAEIITKSSSSINIQQDIKAYLAENKTGVSAPPQIPYTPYDSEIPTVPKPKPQKPKTPGKIGNYNPTVVDILSDKVFFKRSKI